MSTELIDLTSSGQRLAAVRRRYGNSIDLPNLGAALFAVLLRMTAGLCMAWQPDFGDEWRAPDGRQTLTVSGPVPASFATLQASFPPVRRPT